MDLLKNFFKGDKAIWIIYLFLHGDGDNQGDGKKVGAQELHDDVPVQPFQPFLLERVSC